MQAICSIFRCSFWVFILFLLFCFLFSKNEMGNDTVESWYKSGDTIYYYVEPDEYMSYLKSKYKP